MNKITLYHGSKRIIKEPSFDYNNNNSDYGNAFYCTQEVNAAKEWANKDRTAGFLNKYSFDGRGLNVLDLTDKSKYSVLNWVAILLHNRTFDDEFTFNYRRELEYIEKHYYEPIKKEIEETDVIIGYRADDSYFKFPLFFVRSEIRMEKLEDVFLLGYLGVQVAIKSKKAFSRIKFLEFSEVPSIYCEKYDNRIQMANKMFEEVRKEERYKKGTRIIDLVR